MEELRSTEILDKEIESDARKKAAKILARAEEESKTILENTNIRIEEAQAQKIKIYDNKFAQYEKSLQEALPLEKSRFLVAFYTDSVSKAFNDYLENLGEKKRIALIEKRIKNLPAELFEKKTNASVYGFNFQDAKIMLEKSVKNLSKIEEITFEKSGEEASQGNNFHEGVILSSEDSFFRIRLTMDQIIREIRDSHNSELALALFGGRLPE